MASDIYGEIFSRFRKLSSDEQTNLLEHLKAAVQENQPSNGRRSILELRGLGKEIWKGLDAQDYVGRERSSWRG